MLTEGHQMAGSNVVMPILCLADSAANSARNVTDATLAVLRSEMRLASSGTPIAGALEDFAQEHAVFVRCEACAAGAQKPVCSGFLEARLIVLVRSLGHLGVRPLKLAPGLWAMGLQGGPETAALAATAVERFSGLLDRTEWSGQVAIEIEDWVSIEEALRKALNGAATVGPPPELERFISPSEVSPGHTLDALLHCPEELLHLARGVLRRCGSGGGELSREAAVGVVGQLCRQCGVAEPPDEKIGACFERVAQGQPLTEEGLRTFLRAVLLAVARERGHVAA